MAAQIPYPIFAFGRGCAFDVVRAWIPNPAFHFLSERYHFGGEANPAFGFGVDLGDSRRGTGQHVLGLFLTRLIFNQVGQLILIGYFDCQVGLGHTALIFAELLGIQCPECISHQLLFELAIGHGFGNDSLKRLTRKGGVCETRFQPLQIDIGSMTARSTQHNDGQSPRKLNGANKRVLSVCQSFDSKRKKSGT